MGKEVITVQILLICFLLLFTEKLGFGKSFIKITHDHVILKFLIPF